MRFAALRVASFALVQRRVFDRSRLPAAIPCFWLNDAGQRGFRQRFPGGIKRIRGGVAAPPNALSGTPGNSKAVRCERAAFSGCRPAGRGPLLAAPVQQQRRHPETLRSRVLQPDPGATDGSRRSTKAIQLPCVAGGAETAVGDGERLAQLCDEFVLASQVGATASTFRSELATGRILPSATDEHRH